MGLPTMAAPITPTLAGVASFQDQHLSALRTLLARSRQIAEHLVGGEPAEASGAKPQSRCGAIFQMHDSMMDAASLAENISYEIGRIERGLGISDHDNAILGLATGTRAFPEEPRDYRMVAQEVPQRGR